MKNGDIPAMPMALAHPSNDGYLSTQGLTKREYFAGLAMQGLCHATEPDGLWAHDASSVAETAVMYADALLAELEE